MELLAPAGNWQGFKAVLAQKPDVIYLGAGDLNARSEEAQFALSDLPDLVSQARLVGTKIHFTLNVLIRDDEMAQALDLARQAVQAGVAAIIVQDKGLMLALRECLPDVVIHASTQCSVGSREQITELVDLGVSRVVLARELSLDQIADLTAYAHSRGLEVEVFVHGATCMSVSGQCHMSFSRGGRSANRGACAQPCRLSYKVLENNRQIRPSAAYLSPKDLSYFPYLKELSEIGVDFLKIEGRLRSPEYQAQVTAIFQQALTELDQALSDPESLLSKPEDLLSKPQSLLSDSQIFTAERERDLTIAFNRGGGFQAAFLQNQRDADFLSPDQVGHYGYFLGQVTEVRDRQGILVYRPETEAATGLHAGGGDRDRTRPGSWSCPRDKDYLPGPGSQISLKNADGVSVASAPVGLVRRSKTGGLVEIQGFHPRILRQLRLPLTVWQQKQVRVADQDLREQALPKKEGLQMRLSADHSAKTQESGRSYCLELSTSNKSVVIRSEDLENPPQETGSPLSLDRIRQQMGKLGNTPYELASFETDLSPEDLPSWRISDLNALRRAGLDKLMATTERAIGPATLMATYDGIKGPAKEREDQVESSNRPIERPNLNSATTYTEAQVKKIIYLPNYQAGDDLSALDGQAGELYVLPLEEVYQAAQQGLLSWDLQPASWGAYLSPLRAWSCDKSIEATLSELIGQGLKALVSPTSGLAELLGQSSLDLELAGKLDLYLWQGAQISNRQSYAFLSTRGYAGLMISPELSQGEQEDLAAACSAGQSRSILLVSGPLEAMFTRFCPIGYSRGLEACGLCRRRRENKKSGQKQASGYTLQDEEGRRFPLTPKAWADCSLQLWASNPLGWRPEIDCILGINYLDQDWAQLRAILDSYN
ncbi:MAG: U32 family peptidase [Eubacteriales bacterium]|nr:U32 family peptidase [Clostridiales bacterium]MDY5836696.1 U32 family peptidase [Eubacteriales bacterium]